VNAPLSPIVAVLTVAAGAAVLVGPSPLAIAGGLLLAFVLPGVALLRAFFRNRDLTAVERVILTPTLSMGLLIVAGLGIHMLGLRIDRVAWTVATAGVTLVALAVSRLTSRRSPAPDAVTSGERPVGEQTARTPVQDVAETATVVMSTAPVAGDEREPAARKQPRRRRPARQLLPLVLVAAVLAGTSWLSFSTSRTMHDRTVTALSAAPTEQVDAAGNRSVQLSATGLLVADGPYTLTVSTAQTAIVKRTVAVTGDGTPWTERLSLPAAQRLTVSLYRSGDATAYRTLFISAVD
jgi:hypothetical protein